MSIIYYKYNAGDTVKFKDKFHSPTCSLEELAGSVAEITGRALAYNNRPYYYINDRKGEVFAESCFAGLATKPINSLYRDEATGADTLQGSLPSCDTRDSGEFEKALKWNEAKWVEALFQRGEYHCSKCGGFALHKSDGTENPTSFCPHCGKKMINWEEV